MSDPWETRVEPAPPKQGVSPGMIAVIASSVLVLSIAGATGGWLLAGSPEPGPSSSATSSPTAGSSPSAVASLSPSPSAASPSPSAKSTVGFPVPDPGTQAFQTYYAQLRDLNLGVEITFGQDGDAGRVVKTTPAIGSEVHSGITVRIFVAGPPPATDLPNVIGRACSDAKNALTPVGLKPIYKTRQSGVVIKQNPDPAQGGTANWNDKVELTCNIQLTASPTP